MRVGVLLELYLTCRLGSFILRVHACLQGHPDAARQGLGFGLLTVQVSSQTQLYQCRYFRKYMAVL